MSDGERAPERPPRRTRKPLPERQPVRGGQRLSGLQSERTPEYLVIGHICADLLPDGRAVLGGTALYSAIAAARLGWRVGVLTRGRFGAKVAGYQIPSLDEYAGEISIVVQDADGPTFFVNEYSAGRRTQQITRWAGEIDLRGLPPHWRNAKLLHLGPIAQEIDARQTGALTPQFIGVTPQGWMREWPRTSGGRVTHHHLRIPGELLSRVDAVIISDEEITHARDTVELVGSRRLGVITRGELGSRVLYGGMKTDVPGFKVPVTDPTGAGDVFAAAFFVRATDRSASAVTAARFANAAAALSLRGIGASAIPTLADVDAFLANASEPGVRR